MCVLHACWIIFGTLCGRRQKNRNNIQIKIKRATTLTACCSHQILNMSEILHALELNYYNTYINNDFN